MPDKFKGISTKIADRCLGFVMKNRISKNIDYNNVQYCNATHVRDMFLSNDKLLGHLDSNKRHINIGTGCGFMEYANTKYHSLNLKSVDLARATIDPIYKIVQNKLNVKQDYDMKVMRKKDGSDLTIKNLDPFTDFQRWDNAIFVRFLPIKSDLTSLENISKFNKNMKKYVDSITIVIVPTTGGYPNYKLFPNANITDIKTNGGNSSVTDGKIGIIEYDI